MRKTRIAAAALTAAALNVLLLAGAAHAEEPGRQVMGTAVAADKPVGFALDILDRIGGAIGGTVDTEVPWS
ncbi:MULTISPECIES: hypothetical protein [unclassified Streptomyces]|uniref:hypothetical protein n=1 Tax=unclassified Streptomyces TaxID=2593676 RepID=UPI001661D173|nr:MULTISPECIES: hypothetical protein [unclassified Streptomyces]MBD0843372.1 hypothetical protein [Streptomyces sp. TRM68416]